MKKGSKEFLIDPAVPPEKLREQAALKLTLYFIDRLPALARKCHPEELAAILEEQKATVETIRRGQPPAET